MAWALIPSRAFHLSLRPRWQPWPPFLADPPKSRGVHLLGCISQWPHGDGLLSVPNTGTSLGWGALVQSSSNWDGDWRSVRTYFAGSEVPPKIHLYHLFWHCLGIRAVSQKHLKFQLSLPLTSICAACIFKLLGIIFLDQNHIPRTNTIELYWKTWLFFISFPILFFYATAKAKVVFVSGYLPHLRFCYIQLQKLKFLRKSLQTCQVVPHKTQRMTCPCSWIHHWACRGPEEELLFPFS